MHPEDHAYLDEIKRRQRHPRRTPRIAEALNQLLARKGYTQRQTNEVCRDAWNKAGNRYREDTLPGRVRRGVLEVFVRDSSVLQELSFDKHRILTALARDWPDGKIRDLRFTIGIVDG